MGWALGFTIALAIAITGVGAGSLTTPLLLLFLPISPAAAVGTALTFGAVVKFVSVPAYLLRHQINWRVLLRMLIGGVPGVLAGSLLLGLLKNKNYESLLYAVLGLLIALTAAFHLYRSVRPRRRESSDRSRLLPLVTLPIGAEVGFSSAGAGALGSVALFGMTKLSAAEVVGTDIAFGLIVSFIGSLLHLTAGNYHGPLLLKLVTGGVVGALAGSLLAGRIAPLPLRRAVLVMLVLLGTQLAFRGHGSPAPHLQAFLR